MSLSFCEEFALRAAISVYMRGSKSDRDMAIRAASEWAAACCEAWGHDDSLTADDGLSDLFTATCRRCGHVEKRHWKEDE